MRNVLLLNPKVTISSFKNFSPLKADFMLPKNQGGCLYGRESGTHYFWSVNYVLVLHLLGPYPDGLRLFPDSSEIDSNISKRSPTALKKNMIILSCSM